MVKEFLSQRGIVYVLKNLNDNEEARAEFVRAGYLLPPVTVVDGTAVQGFDPTLLERLIARGTSRFGIASIDD